MRKLFRKKKLHYQHGGRHVQYNVYYIILLKHSRAHAYYYNIHSNPLCIGKQKVRNARVCYKCAEILPYKKKTGVSLSIKCTYTSSSRPAWYHFFSLPETTAFEIKTDCSRVRITSFSFLIFIIRFFRFGFVLENPTRETMTRLHSTQCVAVALFFVNQWRRDTCV